MIALKIFLFFLGLVASFYLVTALFGILDLWYAIGRAYPRVIRRILVPGGITAVIAVIAGEAGRTWFGLGLAVYPLLLISMYIVSIFLTKKPRRPLVIE